MTNPVEFQVLQSSSQLNDGSFTDKQIKILSSQDAYELELSRYSTEVANQIDFDTGVVLLADMGQRLSGGYSISVTQVTEDENKVTAEVRLVEPGLGCILTQAVTNPYQFVFIASKKEVTVNETLLTSDCE